MASAASAARGWLVAHALTRSRATRDVRQSMTATVRVNCPTQHGRFHWLPQRRPCRHASDGDHEVGVVRHYYDRDRGRGREKLPAAELEAVHHGHVKVKKYEAEERVGLERIQRLFSVARDCHLRALELQEQRDGVPLIDVIVYEKDAVKGGRHARSSCVVAGGQSWVE